MDEILHKIAVVKECNFLSFGNQSAVKIRSNIFYNLLKIQIIFSVKLSD